MMTPLEQEFFKALKEADAYIRDLVVLLKPPPGKTIEYVIHGGRELSREESVDYTVAGALRFLEALDIRSYTEPAS